MTVEIVFKGLGVVLLALLALAIAFPCLFGRHKWYYNSARTFRRCTRPDCGRMQNLEWSSLREGDEWSDV